VRVLFLTKYPLEGASSRYRVFQYLPFVEAAGIEYEVQSFLTPEMYRAMNARTSTARKFAATIAASIRRVLAVRHAKDFDLVFMQRECLPAGPPILERLVRRAGAKIIFDYDDALFIFRKSAHTPAADIFKQPSRVRRIFRLADCVLAGNEWLRSQAAPYCSDVRVFHVAEDLLRFTARPDHRQEATVTIGWLGSPSTERYLDLIRGPLRTICSRYPHVRVKIIGGGRFADDGIPVEHVPWSLTTEVEQLHTFDIGIMPLPSEEWSLGKSGGKARTYMAVGLPVVCTDIGFNRELVTNDVTGFLVTSHDQWIAALDQLITDSELRSRIGTSARREVEERFSLQRLGPEFVSILKDVGARGK
jgi:glycosyltransferase involved in cell wall biosynthesis